MDAEEFVDRWGNLTPLLDSWNIEASNQAFGTKLGPTGTPSIDAG